MSITTILTPDAGQLFLLGKEMSSLSENERAQFCRRNLGIIFQSLFLIPTLTVIENVTVPLLVAGIHQHDAQNKAMKILQLTHSAIALILFLDLYRKASNKK